MGADTKRMEIFLVPGFLGFETLGELDYFLEVEPLLQKKLGALGIEATVHATQTLPAGSLRRRAMKLAEEVAMRHSPDADSVHFVGHSTGGLDIRVMLSPGSSLDSGSDLATSMSEAEYANFVDAKEKTKTAMSLATPHHGTPIADIAMRLAFDRVLRGADAVLANGLARNLVSHGLRAAGMAASLVERLPGNWSFLDWVGSEVLAEHPDDVLKYLTQVGSDVGALRNLTHECMDLARALLVDRPGVEYGSVVTATRSPRGPIATDDLLLYVNTLLFRRAWSAAADADPNYPYPDRLSELRDRYANDLESELDVGQLDIDGQTNDGVVPSASQIYGRVVGVFASDHLDCVGHYPRTLEDGTHVSGWVRSGASFNEARFELLWGRIAGFAAISARAKKGAGSRGARRRSTAAGSASAKP